MLSGASLREEKSVHDHQRKKIIWGTFGRLIFIHHQCWEVLPFCRFQRQWCIKNRVPRAQDFYTPLALKTAKGQHLPALEVYKNQSPNFSGLKEKLSRPVVDTEILLKKTRKSYLPSKSFLCGPHFFSAKKCSALEQGGVCFLQNPPDRGQSRKIRFSKFPGSGLKKI